MILTGLLLNSKLPYQTINIIFKNIFTEDNYHFKQETTLLYPGQNFQSKSRWVIHFRGFNYEHDFSKMFVASLVSVRHLRGRTGLDVTVSV